MGVFFHVTAWERVSFWRRIVCALGRVAVLLVILGALLMILGPPISIFLTTRWEAKKIPAVRVSAQPLTDYSVSETPGRALSYVGYSFEVPWNADFKTKGFPKDGVIELKFDSGQVLLLMVPSDQRGLLSKIAQDQSLHHMDGLRLVLGNLVNRSAYDQYSALLNTSPSTIRAFGPRPQAARGVSLLTIKAIALPFSLETGAFSFHFPDKRGFQIGDPQKSKIIHLEIFGMNGHHLEIVCGTDKDAARLSQPELNRILKTLHTASLAPLAAHPFSPQG